MKTNGNKYLENRSRQEIISANIENLIDERNMLRTEFQEKMGMSKQEYYKKSKCAGSSYNEEDIYKAAEILGVTVNDLYYDEKEKKGLEVLKNPKYHPIMAQQQVKIKLLNPSFERPSEMISQILIICFVLMIIVYFIAKFSAFYSLLALVIPFYIHYDMKSSFGVEKTYVINYLDDIYYEMKNEKNNKQSTLQILRWLSLILIFVPCLIVTFKTIPNEFNEYSAVLMYIIVTFISVMIGLICYYAFIPKKFKKRIYQNEIKSYFASLIYLILVAITNVFSTTIFAINHAYWYTTICSILALIISAIEFAINSKKHNEYKLMYEEYNHEERQLFPDDYKF